MRAVLISLLAISLLAIDSHATKQADAHVCVTNLRGIDAAKYQWALEHHKKCGDVVTWDEIRPYLNELLKTATDTNGIPICPELGRYTLGKVCDLPTCSIGGKNHTLKIK